MTNDEKLKAKIAELEDNLKAMQQNNQKIAQMMQNAESHLHFIRKVKYALSRLTRFLIF